MSLRQRVGRFPIRRESRLATAGQDKWPPPAFTGGRQDSAYRPALFDWLVIILRAWRKYAEVDSDRYSVAAGNHPDRPLVERDVIDSDTVGPQ